MNHLGAAGAHVGQVLVRERIDFAHYPVELSPFGKAVFDLRDEARKHHGELLLLQQGAF